MSERWAPSDLFTRMFSCSDVLSFVHVYCTTFADSLVTGYAMSHKNLVHMKRAQQRVWKGLAAAMNAMTMVYASKRSLLICIPSLS